MGRLVTSIRTALALVSAAIVYHRHVRPAERKAAELVPVSDATLEEALFATPRRKVEPFLGSHAIDKPFTRIHDYYPPLLTPEESAEFARTGRLDVGNYHLRAPGVDDALPHRTATGRKTRGTGPMPGY